jgi:tetratricopeptide (TPR) repeat protein
MSASWTHEKIVRLLLDAASAHRDGGRLERAEGLIDEAQSLAQAESQSQLLAAVAASRGVLERTEGNLDAAGRSLAEALRIRRGLTDSLGTARALGDLSRVHLEAGRTGEANHCLQEAMELSSRVEPGRTRAEILEHGGILHAREGDADRARVCFEEALTVYEQLGDRGATARVREALGFVKAGNAQVSLDDELLGIEKQRLLAALDGEAWNQSRAARRLGVTETRVRNLMRRHGLRSRNRRGRPRKGGEIASQEGRTN